MVLEDDPRRTNEMQAAVLESAFRQPFRFFDNAYKLSHWLELNAGNVQLISLDHDLDTTTVREVEEAGTGLLIVDWLVENRCLIPVLIHSSNAMRAPAMHLKLATAGWTELKLSPFVNSKKWADDIRRIVHE